MLKEFMYVNINFQVLSIVLNLILEFSKRNIKIFVKLIMKLIEKNDFATMNLFRKLY